MKTLFIFIMWLFSVSSFAANKKLELIHSRVIAGHTYEMEIESFHTLLPGHELELARCSGGIETFLTIYEIKNGPHKQRQSTILASLPISSCIYNISLSDERLPLPPNAQVPVGSITGLDSTDETEPITIHWEFFNNDDQPRQGIVSFKDGAVVYQGPPLPQPTNRALGLRLDP